MTKLTKQQVDTILNNAPKGADKTAILDGLITRGFELEGVDTMVAKQAIQQKMSNPSISIPNELKTTPEPQKEGVLSDLWGDYKGIGSDIIGSADKRAERINQIRSSLESGEKSNLNAILSTVGQIAGAGSDAIGAVFKGVVKMALGPKSEEKAKEVLSKAMGGIDWAINDESSPIKAIGDAIGSNKQLQKLVLAYDTDPNVKDLVDSAGGIASLALDFVGLEGGKQAVKPLAEKAVNLAKDGVDTVIDTTKKIEDVVINKGNDVFNKTTELKNNIQLAVAKKNVNPQLEKSTKRLINSDLENPVATYDKYLEQSKKALSDIKADPAISVVGEKIGDAFDKVIKQRQDIGKVVGSQLKENGGVKISITDVKTKLISELSDSGLSYNPKINKLTSFQGSKFAPDEVKMLNGFMQGVAKLGENPTVSAIDNFISKTRTTLQLFKGKNGVIGTTNAERIINGGLANLRATLNPEVNKIVALTKYWQANKMYSELSDFVEEGSNFLGKKTLTGDFAKDTSVAKSSVQSILNQGKKDFLIKLEALTGYKAIDDSVLALQAMKDAGDFRGLSLLQTMADGNIPTSKSGFVQKIIDTAIEKGSKIVAGTPEEQTRAFLNDLIKNETKKIDDISKKAGDLTNENGGITINIEGDIPQKGFAYSPYKDVETIVSNEAFKQNADKHVSDFITKNFDKLNEEGNHLGVWIDDNGQVFLDISKVIDDEQKAVVEAVKNNQIGLFDLNTLETKLTKDYEKVGSTYKYKGEVKGTNSKGSEIANAEKVGEEKIDILFDETTKKSLFDKGIKYELENVNGEKRVILDLFPIDEIRGKGITKTEVIKILKKAYEKGYEILEPSYGLITKDGEKFNDSLIRDGFIKEVEKRGQIRRFKLTDKLKL